MFPWLQTSMWGCLMCWKGSPSKVKVQAATSREAMQTPAYMQETDIAKEKLLREIIWSTTRWCFQLTSLSLYESLTFPLTFIAGIKRKKAASLSLQNPAWLTAWLGNSPRFSVVYFCAKDFCSSRAQGVLGPALAQGKDATASAVVKSSLSVPPLHLHCISYSRSDAVWLQGGSQSWVLV